MEREFIMQSLKAGQNKELLRKIKGYISNCGKRKTTEDVTENRKKNRRHQRGTNIWEINNMQLVEMLKNLTKTLKELEEITRKELENIMIILDLRYKITESEFERIKDECRAIIFKLKQNEKLTIHKIQITKEGWIKRGENNLEIY